MANARADHPAMATSRLTLRRFEARDAAGLHACLGDAAAMRFWNMPPSVSLDETLKTLAWLSKTSSPYEHLAWAVAENANDECIGMVCYHHREARHRRLEIGFCIAASHQRKGLGTEAVGALVDHCHAALGVHRIEAMVHIGNIASERVLGKLGFVCEGGPLRDYWLVADSFASVKVHAHVATA